MLVIKFERCLLGASKIDLDISYMCLFQSIRDIYILCEVKHNRFRLTIGHLQTNNYKLRIKYMFK